MVLYGNRRISSVYELQHKMFALKFEIEKKRKIEFSDPGNISRNFEMI